MNYVKYYYSLLFSLSLLSSCTTSIVLKNVKLLPAYPSASGIEFLGNKLYIIGDDANDLLILDKKMNKIDTAALYSFPEKRIPKKIKADLEAITTTPDGKLLITGSGSLDPTRNNLWLYDPVSKQKENIQVDTFYKRLKLNAIKELNLEGLTSFSDGYILSSRGSKGFPVNHLVFTKHDFWKKQSQNSINLLQIESSGDSSHFSGISGLTYSYYSDALIMTISTEETRNSLDDGAIGKSYLWIINDLSAKQTFKTISVDRKIELDAADKRFIGQKIESVCIIKETKSKYHLILAADNDNGTSTLFRINVRKE